MTAGMLAIVLTLTNPAVSTAPPAAAILPVTTVATRLQSGLDVHISPIDIAGDFQAKMLELSG